MFIVVNYIYIHVMARNQVQDLFFGSKRQVPYRFVETEQPRLENFREPCNTMFLLHTTITIPNDEHSLGIQIFNTP